MNKNKIIVFQPFDSSSELWVARAFPGSSGSQGGAHPGEHSHSSEGTPTLTWNGTIETHNCKVLTCTSLGCGNKTEYLEKTHEDMGRTCKLHPDSGPDRNQFFSRQHYNKMMLNKMTIFVYCSRVYSSHVFWRTISHTIEALKLCQSFNAVITLPETYLKRTLRYCP